MTTGPVDLPLLNVEHAEDRPPLDDRQSVDVGQSVKVIHRSESGYELEIWLEVRARAREGVRSERYAGRLMEPDVEVPGMDEPDQEILFGPENVAAIR
jgi:hypothetical protein